MYCTAAFYTVEIQKLQRAADCVENVVVSLRTRHAGNSRVYQEPNRCIVDGKCIVHTCVILQALVIYWKRNCTSKCYFGWTARLFDAAGIWEWSKESKYTTRHILRIRQVVQVD